MKGSWIIWFLLLIDLAFVGLIGYFGQDKFTPEQNWYALATLLLYRIIALWVSVIGLANLKVTVKKWEFFIFYLYVGGLIVHSTYWTIGIAKILWPH